MLFQHALFLQIRKNPGNRSLRYSKLFSILSLRCCWILGNDLQQLLTLIQRFHYCPFIVIFNAINATFNAINATFNAIDIGLSPININPQIHFAADELRFS